MRLHIWRAAMILGLIVLCSCNTMLLPMPVTDKAATTPSQTLPHSTGGAENGSGGAYFLPTRDIIPTIGLHCTIYAEGRWGAKPGEFGLCPPSSTTWVRGPYPPVVSADGDIFVVDKANQRIVRYFERLLLQVISLPSSYLLDFTCPHTEWDICGRARWSNVSVSGDRLFLQFATYRGERIVNQLAILSPEGQEQRIIDLEPYYSLETPFLDSLVPDRKGGVYLLLVPGLVHFDAEFRPTFIYHPEMSFENPTVGWDGNFYTYENQSDCVRKWAADDRAIIRGEPLSVIENVITATRFVSPTSTRFLGVDAQGRLYFSTYDVGQTWLVRVSASGERIIAPVVEEWLPLSTLGPDGALYGITYDLEDFSIGPQIVRCVLE